MLGNMLPNLRLLMDASIVGNQVAADIFPEKIRS